MQTNPPPPKKERSPIQAARWSALPLWLQILGWFFLNILLLLAVASIALTNEFKPVIGALMEGRAGNRLSALAGEVTDALISRSREDWPEVTSFFAQTYQIQCALFRQDGAWMAGEIPHPPAAVIARLRKNDPSLQSQRNQRPPNLTFPPNSPPPDHSQTSSPQVIPGLLPPPPPPGSGHFVIHEDGLYWIGVHLHQFLDEKGRRGPATFLISSKSSRAGNLLLEFTPWWIAGVALMGSAIFWIPLVRRITSPLRKMRDAAEQMAAGHFQTRISLTRSDEIGTLAESLNHLASQLEHFVSDQKRFLGDIAHELCSPVARMEWSLGVLEQQADPRLKEPLNDVREEVGLMSNLIEELLCFTRAGLQSEVHIERVQLLSICQQAAHQESAPLDLLQLKIPENLHVKADPHLLKRAISNILRNAFRYSGGNLPVSVGATQSGHFITLSITDQGPGVPEKLIPRLCEPFFRPETARSRDTGGTGLGLAIVKRAIESCGGSVSIKNIAPNGLEVSLTLPASDPSDAMPEA